MTCRPPEPPAGALSHETPRRARDAGTDRRCARGERIESFVRESGHGLADLFEIVAAERGPCRSFVEKDDLAEHASWALSGGFEVWLQGGTSGSSIGFGLRFRVAS